MVMVMGMMTRMMMMMMIMMMMMMMMMEVVKMGIRFCSLRRTGGCGDDRIEQNGKYLLVMI